MIAFLTGRVAGKAPGHALLEVGGVGFRVLMPTSALSGLPDLGETVTVHTYLNVREDELTLYGFEDMDERSLFERLISVSGVGPKVALAALSCLRPDALRAAVACDDVATVSSIPGVGKKTAQRLILELKDKLGVPEAIAGSPAGGSPAIAQARDALLGMGFSLAEASAALRDVEPGASAEQSLKAALKSLGSAR